MRKDFGKLKKVFELFLTGKYSIGKLHKYATNELKLTTPLHKKLGGNLITREYLGKMLHNPIFAGFFFVQGEKYQFDKKLPRAITESQHNKIIQILSNRCNPKVQKHRAVFSGFIKSDSGDFVSQDIKFQMWCDCRHKFAFRDKTNCPKCNRKINDLENPEYFIQSYYYNNRKKRAGVEYKSITESKITQDIIDFADANLQLPSPLLDWSKRHIHEIKDSEVTNNLNLEKDRMVRQEKYENEKKNATRLFIQGKILEEDKNTFLADLEKEYSDLKKDYSNPINWVEQLEEIFDLTFSLKEIMKNGNYEAKRNALIKLGANLTWNEEKLLINNKKSVNTLAENIKKLKPIILEFGNEKALVEQGLSDENSTLCITLRRLWNDVRKEFH